MVTATPSYGANVAMTITLAALASNVGLTTGRQSTTANNVADLADDSLVSFKITTGASPTAGAIFLYTFASVDGGTNYSGNAAATDGALTPVQVAQLRLLDTVSTNSTSNITYKSGPYSIAQAYGGTVPPSWGVFVMHNTVAALNATAGNFTVQYVPVKYASS
jgi:hypothetical protein